MRQPAEGTPISQQESMSNEVRGPLNGKDMKCVSSCQHFGYLRLDDWNLQEPGGILRNQNDAHRLCIVVLRLCRFSFPNQGQRIPSSLPEHSMGLAENSRQFGADNVPAGLSIALLLRLRLR